MPAGDPDCFEFVKLLSLRWDDNWLKKKNIIIEIRLVYIEV